MSARPLPVDGWQTMDSAPKDGTPILLSDGTADYPFVGYFGRVGRFTTSPQMWIGHRFGAMSESDVTHWRPLPAPPAKEA